MPAEPEVYEVAIAIEPGDVDQLGHVNNVVYLRWVQDAAVAHWTARASAAAQAQLYWVVIRHEIDYLQPALPGDGLVARTWVGQATRIRFDRHTEIVRTRDAVVLARARTVWCPIDAESGRPTLVGADVRARFSA